MARIRTIKPGFFKHDVLFDAEKSSGLPLRVAFAGMWTVADREGRFKWQPRVIKVDVLPYDEVDFASVLDALKDVGLLRKYTVDGKEYGLITGFKEHQHVNKNEAPSTLPPPDHAEKVSAPSDDGKRTIKEPSLHHEERKGREQEGKGREQDSVRRTGADAPVEDVDPAGKPEWWPKRDRYGRVLGEVVEKTMFDVGKAVLGRTSGGQIVKLRKLYHGDLRSVTDLLLQADEKSNPAEWIAGVIRRGEVDELEQPKHKIFPEEIYRATA